MGWYDREINYDGQDLKSDQSMGPTLEFVDDIFKSHIEATVSKIDSD